MTTPTPIEAGAIKPRPYDLNDPSEVQRLFREVEGYLHTCRRDHHGTDFEGRQHAMEALKSIATGSLVPASAVADMKERCVQACRNAAEKYGSNASRSSMADELANELGQLDLSPAGGDYVVVPVNILDDVMEAIETTEDWDIVGSKNWILRHQIDTLLHPETVGLNVATGAGVER